MFVAHRRFYRSTIWTERADNTFQNQTKQFESPKIGSIHLINKYINKYIFAHFSTNFYKAMSNATENTIEIC